MGTRRGSITHIECLVDANLTPTSIVLGLPAMQRMKYKLVVANVTAVDSTRTPSRAVHNRQGRRLSERINASRQRHMGREPMRNTQADTRRNLRRYMESDEEDLVIGLSRSEMEEIESWS